MISIQPPRNRRKFLRPSRFNNNNQIHIELYLSDRAT